MTTFFFAASSTEKAVVLHYVKSPLCYFHGLRALGTRIHRNRKLLFLTGSRHSSLQYVVVIPNMLLSEIINYRYKGLLLRYYSSPLQQTVPYFTEKSGTFFIAEEIEQTAKTEL